MPTVSSIPLWLAIELGLTVVALVVFSMRQVGHNRSAFRAIQDALKEQQAALIEQRRLEHEDTTSLIETLQAMRQGQAKISATLTEVSRVLANLHREMQESEKRNIQAHTEMLTRIRDA